MGLFYQNLPWRHIWFRFLRGFHLGWHLYIIQNAYIFISYQWKRWATPSSERSSKQLYSLVVIPYRAHNSRLLALFLTPSTIKINNPPLPNQTIVFIWSTLDIRVFVISYCARLKHHFLKCNIPNIAVHVKNLLFFPSEYIFLYYSTDFTTNDCV